MPAAKSTKPDPIEPDAYYDVTVSTPFTFERVRFGPQTAAEISGTMLTRLLASENAALVTSHTLRA